MERKKDKLSVENNTIIVELLCKTKKANICFVQKMSSSVANAFAVVMKYKLLYSNITRGQGAQ